MLNRNTLKTALYGASLLMLTSCNGMFDGIYDDPEQPSTVAAGELLVDATSWTDWYYIDLDSILTLTDANDEVALQKALTTFTAYPIPMDATGSATTAAQQGEKSGQYMYWFDVFGEGIKKNEYRSFTPTAAQPEPASWSFAVHRNNVRTNGGAVYKTTYTDMDAIPESSDAFKNAVFTEDTWTENAVWDDQSQMLNCFVPSQGIRINTVLSSWLSMDIPPVPPLFTMDSSVFILRLKNGKYAALQLKDYMSAKGVKCWLTIKYKYPY